MLAAALLLVTQQPALSGAGAPTGFTPQPASAEEIRALFPDAWKLPRVDHQRVALPCQRFEQQMLRLAREPLATGTESAALMLGDLLARATAASRQPTLEAARKEIQALLADARARVPAALWPQVEPLLDVREFLSPKWDPDDDEKRSGFLTGPSWELPAACWPAVDGKRKVEQCAVFIAADLASIKLAEADFPAYFEYPDNNYLHVAAVPHTYRAELLPDREPVAGLTCAARTTLTMDFESDLPFPFGTYACRLRMLTELNEEGRAITWVHSDSPDFYWLAGYDLYEPVHDASGAFVGLLVIRQFGCDLDGVPDGGDNHRGGMRTVLGGVKRQAEALWRERAAAGPFPLTGAVPVFAVVPGKSR